MNAPSVALLVFGCASGAVNWGAAHFMPAPNSASVLGGEPVRSGGSPPSDTSRAPGSSGLSGAGIANSLVGGSLR